MAPEAASSLGEFLRQERERRGITLEQVASATKISVRMLQSLESDHYVDLPATPFIRGFVNSYARFIGLEPDEILTRFKEFIDVKAKDRPCREAGHSGYAFEKREGEQSRTFLWVVMGSFVLLGGLLLFVFKPSLRHHHQSHAERLRLANVTASPSPSPSLAIVFTSPSVIPSGKPDIASPSPSPSGKPTKSAKNLMIPFAPSVGPLATPVPVASPSGKPDPLNSGIDLKPSEIRQKIVVKSLGDVWVRYKVDEKAMMKFMLRKDRVLVLRGKTAIRFQASNFKSVTINQNGTGAKIITNEKSFAMHPSGQTLIMAPQGTENSTDPFPQEKTLPLVVPTIPRGAVATPTPTP